MSPEQVHQVSVMLSASDVLALIAGGEKGGHG